MEVPNLVPTLREVLLTIPLLLWNLFVVLHLSRWTYKLVARYRGERAGVYVARKVIHFLAGGLTALLVPLVYTSPVIPVTAAMLLAVMTYLPHRRGQLMYWFQVPENIAEVYFCIVWGLLMAVAWYINVWLAIVPIFFMACGDGVTGIVRCFIYNYRNKSWYGNLAMALLCIPVGYLVFGIPGAIAGLIASIIEHFEFIDDNISVPLLSFLIILLFTYVIPIPTPTIT